MKDEIKRKRTKWPNKKKPKESPFKGRVARNLFEISEKNRGTGAWLNRAIEFDHSLKLRSSYRKKVERFIDEILVMDTRYKREQKITDLEILLSNLFRKGKHKPLMVSRNRNDWSETRFRKASYFTIELMDALAEQGFIEMKTGYKTNTESRLTRIWPTDKLLDHFKILPEMVVYEPVQLVELKTFKGRYNKKGKEIYELTDYKETATSLRVSKILKKANEVNGKADIKLNKNNRKFKVSTALVAIYRKDFSHYGRLHTRGTLHYQSLSGDDERPYITINGNKTVELDFKGLHPNLLYAAEGIQFQGGDPYSMVNEHPHAREFLKIILLSMLNAKDFNTAQAAANYWLYLNGDSKNKLREIEIKSAKPLMQGMFEAHPEIEHYFCSGSDVAMKTMNKDASIALDVVKHFTKQNIPILVIHDSFIIEKQHRYELMEVMKSMYRKHTKGFEIEVTASF